MALSAIAATSAAAAVVPAKFSSSQIKLTTSGITLKRNGGEARTCTAYGEITGSTESSFYWVFNQWEGNTLLSCTSSINKLSMITMGEVSFDTVANKYSLGVNAYNSYPLESPWGYYSQEAFSGTWVNGSGITPSKVTFTNQTIGWSTGKMTIDGSFNVTTPAGGLVTLSH